MQFIFRILQILYAREEEKAKRAKRAEAEGKHYIQLRINCSLETKLTADSVWRFGPGRYWYDLYGVPEDATPEMLKTILERVNKSEITAT